MIRHKQFASLRRLVMALAALALAAAPSASAAPGDLDSTFGTGGIVQSPLATDDYVRDVALQPDGKIVAAGASSAGSGYRFAVARYNADGTLDATFGSGGKVITPVGSNAAANAVAIQSDGRIVVAGRGGSAFAVARYTADGVLDASFGSAGVATAAVGNEATAWDVVVEPDGRIAVAGQARVSGKQRIALARFTAAGALDSTFGTSGTTTLALGASDSYGHALVRQTDGRLVVAGGASDNDVFKFALVRFTAAGALDTSFGSGGSALTTVGFGSTAYSLLSDPDGNLIAGGMSTGFSARFAIARYSADGALDGSFGNGGVASSQPGLAALGNSVARQADGRLVVVGSVIGTDQRFGMTRFNADGTLDSGFGTNGSVTTTIGTAAEAFKVAVQADGRILAAGTGGTSGARTFALARYEAAAPPVDPPADDPPVDDPPADDPPADDPPADDPPADDPPPTDPPVTDPPVVNPPPTDPPVTDPPVVNPPPADPPATNPPAPGTGLGGQVVAPETLGELPPDVRPIFMPAQALKLTDGFIPVRLRCAELPGVNCRGTVVITAPLAALGVRGGGHSKGKITASRRRKTKTKMKRIARRKVTIPSGGRITAPLKLSTEAKRAVARRGSLRVTVEATMVVDGKPRTARRTFTVRAPRKSRRG